MATSTPLFTVLEERYVPRFRVLDSVLEQRTETPTESFRSSYITQHEEEKKQREKSEKQLKIEYSVFLRMNNYDTSCDAAVKLFCIKQGRKNNPLDVNYMLGIL